MEIGVTVFILQMRKLMKLKYLPKVTQNVLELAGPSFSVVSMVVNFTQHATQDI